MGHWSMHIEGAGIHDNGRDDDAEALLKEFAGKLAKHHSVHSVTFTVGSARELVNMEPGASGDPLEPAHVAEAALPLRPGFHGYRHRDH
jgi:hypothetical protein